MHLPQQSGWLRGEALVHNSKFVSADNKESKDEDVFKPVSSGQNACLVFPQCSWKFFTTKKKTYWLSGFVIKELF